MNKNYLLPASDQVGRTSEGASHHGALHFPKCDAPEELLRPYPAYKDSGVPWLGDVPAHWEVLPGRACYREKKVPNTGLKETTVLSLSYGQIVVKPPEKLHGLVPASFETYQIVDPGDIIIRPTDLQNDWNSLRFGLSRHRGIITSAYMCFHTQDALTRDYGHLLLHTYDLMKIFYGLGSGLRQNLDWTDFKYLPCLAPPLPEQRSIAAFLDAHDRLTRRYIHAQQRLIKLLTEQKQALIQQAVTRGLDPNVPLKDSGIPWLGKIPAHWGVVSLGHITIKRCDGPFGSSLKSTHYTNKGVRVVRLQNIGAANFRNDDVAYISPEYYATLGDHNVLPGDLLVAGLGDNRIPAGRACVAPADIEPAMVKADCFRFRLDRNQLDPQFTAYHLSATANIASAMLSTGATRQRINLQSTSARAIALPPLHEQENIVQAIGDLIRPIDVAISHTHRQIALVREYRTRLIADVVTGKLDVRGFEVGRTSESASHLEDAAWEDLDDEETGDSLDDLDVDADIDESSNLNELI